MKKAIAMLIFVIGVGLFAFNPAQAKSNPAMSSKLIICPAEGSVVKTADPWKIIDMKYAPNVDNWLVGFLFLWDRPVIQSGGDLGNFMHTDDAGVTWCRIYFSSNGHARWVDAAQIEKAK